MTHASLTQGTVPCVILPVAGRKTADTMNRSRSKPGRNDTRNRPLCQAGRSDTRNRPLCQAGRSDTQNRPLSAGLSLSIAMFSNQRFENTSIIHFSVLSFHSSLKKASPPGGLFYYHAVGWLAASIILTNFSGTREAPPMRPPSMSGWARSSKAFLSFMEPP